MNSKGIQQYNEIKLGTFTSFFRDHSLEESIKIFSSNGWKYLDMSEADAKKLLEKGNPGKTGRYIYDFAASHGVSILQGHLLLSCDVASPNQQEVIDTMKRWLELFAAVGIKSAVIHSGGKELVKAGVDKQVIDQKRAHTLRFLTEFIEDTDMAICLENTVSAIPDADGLCELVDLVGNPHLGICLDTGHLNISGGSQSNFIIRAGGYLRALHIHDNEGNSDQHRLPFSGGNIDWKDVTEALKKINYKGLFSLEIPFESKAPKLIRIAKLSYFKQMFELMMDAGTYEC